MVEDIRNAAIAVALKVFETMFFIPLEPQERKQEKDEFQSAQEQRDVVNLSSESSTDSGADEISPTY